MIDKDSRLTFTSPSDERSATAHAHARRMGHILGEWVGIPWESESYSARAICQRCGCELLIIREPEGDTLFEGRAGYEPCDVCREEAKGRRFGPVNDLPEPPGTRVRTRQPLCISVQTHGQGGLS